MLYVFVIEILLMILMYTQDVKMAEIVATQAQYSEA